MAMVTHKMFIILQAGETTYSIIIINSFSEINQ